MMIPSLLIVTDRGGLRAYKVDSTPNRAPALHLLDSFEAGDAHGRYQDKVTDQAGRNYGSDAGGRHVGGSDERLTFDMENSRRACKQVAARINELVKREKPEAWLLAVPAQIHQAVEDHIDADAQFHLTQTVHADLLRLEPAKIAQHFSALQHA